MDDPGDSPLYYMTHLIDITKRKEAEQKLLEVQDSYNLISENARDIIYFSTPDGVCRYISPSITDLLGYKPEEMIGKTNFEHYHPDDIAGLIAREPSEEEALTYRLRHADGRYLWFETSFRMAYAGAYAAGICRHRYGNRDSS
jgi:PAS domain S-box-containing protein